MWLLLFDCKAWDHCRLVHDIWLHALQNNTHLWIERVPSHDNIADSPTRGIVAEVCVVRLRSAYCLHASGAYEIMERLREIGEGEWKRPVVASVYLRGESALG